MICFSSSARRRSPTVYSPFRSASSLRSSFIFRSCSMICLLQLATVSAASAASVQVLVLSAGEEAALLGHLVAVLEPCANHPDDANEAEHHAAQDKGVALPVGGLGIPTARRRPDVLRVPGRQRVSSARHKALARRSYGILFPPPIVECCAVVMWTAASSSGVRLLADAR